jgi:threonine/homoserine/homoserine lactone efflux protein
MFASIDLGIVHLGFFCVAVLLLNLTPGPDTAFIVGQSVAHGRRAGLMSVLGISAGCVVHTIAIALGLSALLAASTSAFLVVKLVGAAYLVYLGARMIVATLRHGRLVPHEAPSASHGPGPILKRHSGRRTFMQGFLTNVTNPKVVLFFLSLFPQFVSAESAHKGLAFAVLGAVLIVISTFYNGAVAWIAGSITKRMKSAPRVQAWLERSVGAMFIALGARIALTDR